jgi:hypothetical protein
VRLHVEKGSLLGVSWRSDCYYFAIDVIVGVDVTLTDVKEVLPLLKRNYEQNLSPAALRGECWG